MLLSEIDKYGNMMRDFKENFGNSHEPSIIKINEANNINKEIDRYGNVIYNIVGQYNIDNLQSDNECVIIKINKRVETKKFKYVVKLYNVHVYANPKAMVNLPVPVFGKLRSSACIAIVAGPKWNYIVGVKSRDKNWVSMVRGGRNYGESAAQCMLRELKEETSISSSEIESIEEIDLINYMRPYLKYNYPGECQRYLIHITLSKDRIDEIRNYKNDEIEKVYLIRIPRFNYNKMFRNIQWISYELGFIRNIIHKKQIKNYSYIFNKNSSKKNFTIQL